MKLERDAYHVAVDLLSRREHTQLELRTKLEKRGFSEVAITATMARLQQHDLQSDQRYVEDFVRARVLKGYGPLRIRHDCNQRGVAESLLNEHLAGADYDWFQLAQTTYAKKYRHIKPEDAAEKAKRVRFMQSRGFPSDIIFQLLD